MKLQRRSRAVFGALFAAGSLWGSVPAEAQLLQPKAELTPVAPAQTIRPGQAVTLELSVRLPEDIHVQSDSPREAYLIPTVLTLAPVEGVRVEGITYPEATDWYLTGEPEPLAVFGSEFTIQARLAIAADVSTGALVVPGRFQYQACDDRMCFIPASAAVEWRLRVQPAALP